MPGESAESRPCAWPWTSGQKPTADYLREKGAQDLSDALLLGKKLREKEAIIWHLFHTGWVIKTKSSLLIFDYDYDQADNLPCRPPSSPACPAARSIPNRFGIRRCSYSFRFSGIRIASIPYCPGRKPSRILPIYAGEDRIKDSAFVYIEPRKQKKLKDLEISTIKSNGFGVGFAVKVDGLTIFYGGDHQSSDQSWNSFSSEIDFLHEKIKEFDLVFLQMMFQEQIQSGKGVFYALDKLKPAVLFPNSAIAAAPFYKEFIREAAAKKINSKLNCAEKRGDLFFFK